MEDLHGQGQDDREKPFIFCFWYRRKTTGHLGRGVGKSRRGPKSTQLKGVREKKISECNPPRHEREAAREVQRKQGGVLCGGGRNGRLG